MRGQRLDIRHLASDAGKARVAVVVAKFGHSAVARNTLKRQLRELARARLLPRVGEVDVLLRAKREAYGAEFAELRDEVDAAAARLAR